MIRFILFFILSFPVSGGANADQNGAMLKSRAKARLENFLDCRSQVKNENSLIGSKADLCVRENFYSVLSSTQALKYLIWLQKLVEIQGFDYCKGKFAELSKELNFGKKEKVFCLKVKTISGRQQGFMIFRQDEAKLLLSAIKI